MLTSIKLRAAPKVLCFLSDILILLLGWKTTIFQSAADSSLTPLPPPHTFSPKAIMCFCALLQLHRVRVDFICENVTHYDLRFRHVCSLPVGGIQEKIDFLNPQPKCGLCASMLQ